MMSSILTASRFRLESRVTTIRSISTTCMRNVSHRPLTRSSSRQKALNATSYRNASTAASIASISNSSSRDLNELASTPTNWELPSEGLSGQLVNSNPHIGYLKELGLDFGWGPTSIIQWSMEHLQVTFDLPVWTAAIGLTAIMRFMVLPLALDASDMSARMKAMNPRILPIRQKMMEAMAAGDQNAQVIAQRELMHVNKTAGIKLSVMFRPLLIQAPLAFGLFRLTRAMSDLPVPGLDTAGLGWLSNLTIPDPYFVLPIATSGLLYFSMKRGMADNPSAVPGMARMFVKIIPFITLVAASWLPALTQSIFLSGAIFQFGQTELLRNSELRQKLGLHPMDIKSKDAPESYKGTISFEEDPRQKSSSKQPGNTLNKVAKAPSEAFKSLKTSTNELMDRAKSLQSKKHQRLTESELKSATSYETKRRNEEDDIDRRRKDRERRKRLGKQ